MTLRHLMTHTSGLSYGFLNRDDLSLLRRGRHQRFHVLTLEEFARVRGVRRPCCMNPAPPGTTASAWTSSAVSSRSSPASATRTILSGISFGPWAWSTAASTSPGQAAPIRRRLRAQRGKDRHASHAGPSPQRLPHAALDGLRRRRHGRHHRRLLSLRPDAAERRRTRRRPRPQRSLRPRNSHRSARPRLGKAPLGTLATSPFVPPTTRRPQAAGPRANAAASAAMAFNNLGFGLCGSVVRPGAMPIFGSAGSYWWGGLASTEFWIDPAENLVAILCTQLIPSGTYPTRMIFSSGVYKSIEERRAVTP
jgi:CubicO group peptidase (beta-lactamase class C family)